MNPRRRSVPLEALTQSALIASLQLVALSCAGASTAVAHEPYDPHGSSADAASGAPLPLARRSTLLYQQLGGSRFSMPLVRVTLGDREAWMEADTGAGRHVVQAWLPQEANVPTEAGGTSLRDAAGRVVPTRVLSHPRIVIDGWGPLADEPIAVIESAPSSARLRFAENLSPQRLAGAGEAIVLDLDRGLMESAPCPAIVETLRRRGGALTREPVPACRTGRSVSFVVSATIDGERAALEIDTGAPGTLLFASSRAALALAPRVTAVDRATPYTASGARLEGAIRAAHVRIGDVVREVDVLVAPESARLGCPLDGFVGVDFLRTCVLAMAPDELVGRCEGTD